MNRTKLLEKIRTMQFEQMYRRWKRRELRQADAAGILNVSERTFRRYVVRYENGGTEGLLDKRIERHSPRRASVERVRHAIISDNYPKKTVCEVSPHDCR